MDRIETSCLIWYWNAFCLNLNINFFTLLLKKIIIRRNEQKRKHTQSIAVIDQEQAQHRDRVDHEWSRVAKAQQRKSELFFSLFLPWSSSDYLSHHLVALKLIVKDADLLLVQQHTTIHNSILSDSLVIS